MISLKDWMECVNYRITEGSDYCWQSYGPNAYSLDSWDEDQDGVSACVIFDTKTQTVYQAEVHDYSKKRSYRLFNPDFKSKHDQEATDKTVDMDEAYDGVKFTDLETDGDFLTKLRAIMNYEEYDDRVSVPIELPDDELFKLMCMAHERDITFNQLVEECIRSVLEDFESNPEKVKRKFKEFQNA